MDAEPWSGAGRRAQRILLVLDTPADLESLAKAVIRHGSGWRLESVRGGRAALDALADEPAEIVMCDERISDMDGADLLTAVRERHPGTVRLLLAGPALFDRPSRAAIVAHRLIPNSCTVAELSQLFNRVCALHSVIGRVEAHRMAVAATTLPSRP